MEKTTKCIHFQKDSRLLNSKPLAKGSTCLQDLNYDCLREIFKHLDLAAQFSLAKSSNIFYNLILYNSWYPYYESIFDITKDQSMAKQTKEFQNEFLDLILKNFNKIKGISIDNFNYYLSKTKSDKFEHISSLGIVDNKEAIDHDRIWEMGKLQKFPKLLELHIENICIEFSGEENLSSLKALTLNNVKVLNDTEGDFLVKVFSANLEELSLTALPLENLNLKNFSPLNKCSKLRELSLSSKFLSDSRVLDLILDLPSLHILTLESSNSIYFSSDDHTIFYAILKIFCQHPYKTITGLHLNGIPEKLFFCCPYLKNIRELNWMVSKIFHRRQDGSLEWKSNIPQIIQTFYDFVINSDNLQTLYVKDNKFHKKRVVRELNFVQKLHEWRTKNGFTRLNIVESSYTKICNQKHVTTELAEGFIRFFITKQVNS